MEKITWQVALVLLAVVGVLGWMFAGTTDLEMQRQILGYFDTIIGFLAGGVTGLAVGAVGGYWRGLRDRTGIAPAVPSRP